MVEHGISFHLTIMGISFIDGENERIATMPYKPLNEYEPRQRGIVAQAKKAKGNKYLKDGDTPGEECPYCCVLLRVSRKKRGQIMLVCPCGYKQLASG